jgi:hypothetical protein
MNQKKKFFWPALCPWMNSAIASALCAQSGQLNEVSRLARHLCWEINSYSRQLLREQLDESEEHAPQTRNFSTHTTRAVKIFRSALHLHRTRIDATLDWQSMYNRSRALCMHFRSMYPRI